MNMPEETVVEVPPEHLETVWQNRQVQTAALNYAHAPVEGNAPLSETVRAGLCTAQQITEELIAADFNFPVSLDAFMGKDKLWQCDIVKHHEGVLDNIEVSVMIESYYPEWWEDELWTKLVLSVLFVSRMLRLGCQIRYPLISKAIFGKFHDVEVVLPSGVKLNGERIFLRK